MSGPQQDAKPGSNVYVDPTYTKKVHDGKAEKSVDQNRMETAPTNDQSLGKVTVQK